MGLSRLTDRQGFYSARVPKQLLHEIEETKPDVIHLHNVHGYYLNMPLLFSALQQCRTPVIWTLHDCWAFTGHCAYFDFARCEKWRTHCRNCPQKGMYPTSYGLDNSERNFDDKRRLTAPMTNLTLVTPSDWMAKLVKQSFLRHHTVEVVRNGVDQATYRPTPSNFKEERGLQGRSVILGVASPWSERKGMRDFIELSRRLGEQYVVVLVGVGPEMARKLPSAIVSIDRTDSPSELAAIYSAADVFFNPTYEDNYPTTNLEAISCGTPVVTYDTGGSPESVTDGNGAVVPQGDVERAALFISDFRRRRFRTTSQQLRFGNRLMTDRYLALYGRTAS